MSLESPTTERGSGRPSIKTFEKIVKPVDDSGIDVLAQYGKWYLCSDSEELLNTALRRGATLVVNDSLVVKFVGKLTGLCVQRHETKNGKVFEEGSWYSPTDKPTRKVLEQAFDDGEPRVELFQGTWAFMRTLKGTVIRPNPRVILENAQWTVADPVPYVPNQIGGMSRRKYRLDHSEAPHL